ncbi:hypothetical protein ACWDA3_23010 [Nonomuraea rubra]
MRYRLGVDVGGTFTDILLIDQESGRSRIRTGADLRRLTEAAAFIGERLGSPVPALLGRAGDFPPP